MRSLLRAERYARLTRLAIVAFSVLGPAVAAPQKARSDASVQKEIKAVLERTISVDSLRCRTMFEFLIGAPLGVRSVSSVGEYVYDNGVHCWCGSFPIKADALATIVDCEEDIERTRVKKDTAAAVAELEKKLGKLHVELRERAGDDVVVEHAGRWARNHGGKWLPCRRPVARSFLPDPRFLAELLVDLIPNSKWTKTVGTLRQKPVLVYRATLDRAASTRLLIARAITDVGFRGYHDSKGFSIQGNGWSSSSSGRTSMDVDCEVVVYVDPPSKLTHRIRVNIRSVAVEGVLARTVRRAAKRAKPETEIKKSKWTCRLDFDLRRHGRSSATEIDAEARAALRLSK